MFEVCSAATPVGIQFFTHRFRGTGNRGPNTRCHEAVLVNPPATPGGRLPDARENRGLDLRALGVRHCTRARPPHPVPLQARSREAPFDEPDDWYIVLLPNGVKDYFPFAVDQSR